MTKLATVCAVGTEISVPATPGPVLLASAGLLSTAIAVTVTVMSASLWAPGRTCSESMAALMSAAVPVSVTWPRTVLSNVTPVVVPNCTIGRAPDPGVENCTLTD